MSGGEWLIRQHSLDGRYATERVTIETTASGTEPKVTQGERGLVVHYADGRILIFPWANIVRAEYRPHPQP